MPLSTLRAAAIVAALVPAALVGLAVQKLILRFDGPRPWLIPMLFHRYALSLIGVRRTVIGAPAPERPLLMTSNHASWLDICALGAVTPLSFVAKAEIAGWPVFGTFSKLQRSIFVDRTRRTATGAVSRQMADRMTAGDAVVLFAEGTSSDGNRVLPFRSALLGAARTAIVTGGETVFVQPVSIAYTHRNGLPMGLRAREAVAWYGDIEFAPHLWAILKDGAIDMTITFGRPVAVDGATDRKVLARELEREVRRMTVEALRGRPPGHASAGAPVRATPPAAQSRDRIPDEPEPSAAAS